MLAKRKSDSYLVQVARIRIETAVVEVAAKDDAAATRAAINRAKRLPAAAWTVEPYDGRSYQPHVQALVSSEELVYSIEEGGADTTREAEIDIQASATRYVVLKANCDTAETDVILEPWLTVDQPDLMTSDICRAWITELEQAGLTHLSDRLDQLSAGAKPTVSDKILFGATRHGKRKR